MAELAAVEEKVTAIVWMMPNSRSARYIYVAKDGENLKWSRNNDGSMTVIATKMGVGRNVFTVAPGAWEATEITRG